MKFTINGESFVATSKIKVRDILTLKQHNPKALVMRNDDGEILVAVDFEEGKHCLTGFSITFGGKSRDAEEYATFTGILPVGLSNDSAKEYITEKFMPILPYLEQAENNITQVAQNILNTKNELMNAIEIN